MARLEPLMQRGVGMRVWSLAVLGLGGIIVAISGWNHLWPLFHRAGGLALVGWLLGMLGLALLVGRRKSSGPWRFGLGVICSALGMALLAVPHDGQGLLTGLRVGYGGALLAVLPHSFRLYRAAHSPREGRTFGSVRKEVL